MGAVLKSRLRFIMSVLAFACLLHNSTGKRLSCVQCRPTDPRCESGSIHPTLCDEEDRYCVTCRVITQTSQGIYRGCSAWRLRGCRHKVIEDQEVVICFQTCSWYGCNFRSKGYLL